MTYTNESYTRFLQSEIDYQKYEFEQLVKTQAVVLKDNGKVFVGKYMTIDEHGIAVFKIPVSDYMPKKNSFYTASYFSGEMCKPRNWSNYSWLELIQKYQKDYSDVCCVYTSKAEEKDFCLIGIKGLSMEFVELMGDTKPIIAFGPQYPPLQYYFNLKYTVCKNNQFADKILYYSSNCKNHWQPDLIHSKDNFTTMIIDNLQADNCLVIQGPPGTGKTFRMAQIAAKLLQENKSVLVTAFTNQALMELAKKEDLKDFVSQGRVSKTSLTTDEYNDLPNLQRIKKNECNATKGNLTLASFYISSGWAKTAEFVPFDYAIMDEASQAIFPMIAASFYLAKKVIWIGDQKQLAPISKVPENIINQNNWYDIVDGFGTLCKTFDFKSYMLCDTFRLTKRSADCTGIFYDNKFNSVSQNVCDSKIELINPKGGPIIYNIDMEIGNKAPKNALDAIFNLAKALYNEDKKREIAILSKLNDSVRSLQKYFTENWQTKKYPDNIKIETVDRVQGLTVDFCIFFIPNTSIIRSLENALFNVATSRAKQATIIVADKGIMGENMSEEVRKYLLKAQEDKFAAFEPKKITSGNVSVSVVGKINLPQPNKTQNKIPEDAVIVIDTNAFVKCPDIIGKVCNKYKIVIPAKVLEELDKLKLKPEIDKQKINTAARNINDAFKMHFSRMEDADINLLPKSFDKKNPDCMILSVALKHKNKAVLLTSDNMLIARASGLNVNAISLNDFLKQL